MRFKIRSKEWVSDEKNSIFQHIMRRRKICVFSKRIQKYQNSLKGRKNYKKIAHTHSRTFFLVLHQYKHIFLVLSWSRLYISLLNTRTKRSQIADLHMCRYFFLSGFFSWLKKFEFQINAKKYCWRGWKASSRSWQRSL